MAKSRRKTYKKRMVEVNLGELQGIVDAAGERALTAEEHKKLVDSHQLLVDLIVAAAGACISGRTVALTSATSSVRLPSR